MVGVGRTTSGGSGSFKDSRLTDGSTMVGVGVMSGMGCWATVVTG